MLRGEDRAGGREGSDGRSVSSHEKTQQMSENAKASNTCAAFIRLETCRYSRKSTRRAQRQTLRNSLEDLLLW